MFAVIETGGKQYKVNEGDIIYVEKLDVNEGETVTFDCVKALSTADGFKVGAPTVEGATVTANVIANGKGKKIYVIKYKSERIRQLEKNIKQLGISDSAARIVNCFGLK